MCASASSTRRPTRARGTWASCWSGRTTIRIFSTASPTAPTRSRTSSRTSPSRLRGGSGQSPTPRALEQGQDRLVEKELFRSLGIPTARYGSLEDSGLPALVKSRRLGYDGKGQRVVESPVVLEDDELAEEVVSFDRELSIVAARGRDGETAFYPLAENEHRGGILAVSRAPAPDAPQGEAEEIATKLLDALGYVGVLAVELFEVEGTLLANEFAPRVHNTGHWTIDGAVTSQFENHVRAVLGLPLGSTEALGESVMLNLVGDAPPLERLLGVPGAHVHLYGKTPRAGRKLGHVTLVDADEDAHRRGRRSARGRSLGARARYLAPTSSRLRRGGSRRSPRSRTARRARAASRPVRPRGSRPRPPRRAGGRPRCEPHRRRRG